MSRTPSDDDPLSAPAPEQKPSVADAPDADNSAALLAELDVLLERMMALPVNELEEDNTPLRQPERPPEHIAVNTVAEAMSESPLHTSVDSSDDLYVQSILHPPIEELPATSLPEPVAVYSSPEPELPILEAAPSLSLPPIVHTSPEPEEVVKEEPSPWDAPVRWCNDGYDRVLDLFGSPGRWLQGPLGRTFVGIAGLLMLLAVAGLALSDCLDWTW